MAGGSGVTTHVGSVAESSDTTAANLDLSNNPVYRGFTQPVAPTAQALALPEMGGSGWVRDLREAMSLGTPAAAALAAKVQQFAQAGTREAQRALLDDVLRAWAETNQVQAPGPADDPHRRFVVTGDAAASARLQWAIPILEVFNGMRVGDAGMQNPVSALVNADPQPVLTYTVFANQAPIMLSAYDALRESVYSALVVQTRLKPYLDAIELVIDENGVRFDATAAIALAESKAGADALNAVADLIDLKKYAEPTLKAMGWEVYQTLGDVLQGALVSPEVQALLATEKIAWIGVSATTFTVTGHTVRDVIGNAAANVLTGGASSDRLYGLGGNDTISGWGGTNVLDGGDGDDTLTGTADYYNWSANTLLGGAGNDTLSVNTAFTSGNVFDGGSGTDTLSGSAYNDTYRFSLGNGLDTIFERYAVSGYNDKIVFGPGIAPADISVFRSGSNLVFRHANGTDQLVVDGWFSSSTYWVETVEFADGTSWDAARTAAAALVATNGTASADTLTGTATADQLSGLDGNDSLEGLAGHDWLDGGLGADAMRGGTGDDVYVVDDAADTVTELANEGRDAVRASVTWTLGAHVEDLVLAGTAAINGTGNALDNVMYGNDGVNALAGGAGNDRYYVGTGDSVTEAANAGIDTVVSTATWTLGANVENLVLTGSSAINGTGNSLANSLTGNDAANSLNGGAGADIMAGAGGADVYTVDNAGDVVTESANQGIDRINSSVSWSLGAHVENLTLTGSAAINGTGNELDNAIIGNSGANTLTGGAGHDTLNGGAGADTMIGGAGHDTYVVDNAGDVVTEATAEGTDLVQSGIAWTLGANVENLTLTGSAAIAGTGNELDNTIIGNSGANTLTGGAGHDTLDGGAGADTLVGGTGSDTYVVNVSTDVVTESANEGIDTVRAAVTWTLGANLESLVLLGSNNSSGTGNALDNMLTGNAGNNTLAGGEGHDTYRGGLGTDTLSDTSTTSHDIYVWGRGDGADTLTDAGGNDRLDILAGVSADQLWFRRVGNNLEMSVIGSTDRFTINGWYTSAANQVETFRLSDGQTLLASQVQQLVNAMAAFAPPAAGQSTLPPDYAATLQPVIAANWQ